jgi:4-aminobutyrate aminotransferase-like enzyme
MFGAADFPGGAIVKRARDKGLIIKIMGPALEFAPPLIITTEEIDWGLRVLDECLTEEERARGLTAPE